MASRTLRVIGGAYKNRRILLPSAPELRPTLDRVRETLFNWLQTQIDLTHCLDAYAGSGALGLEALSRGAAHCTFVDHQPACITAIRRTLINWRVPSERYHLYPVKLEKTLIHGSAKFDGVFLDPPFAIAAQRLVADCRMLITRQLLYPDAWIYYECLRENEPDDWPGLRLYRKAHSQRIAWGLLHF